MSSETTIKSTDRSDAGKGSGFGEFFRYHGWLSPGVRVFRRLSFTAKAVCIASAFLIPLALMLMFLVTAANDQIDFTRSERRGLMFVKPTLELMKAAQDRRNVALENPAALDAEQGKVKQAFEAVQARHAELAKDIDIAGTFAAVLKAHDALMQAPTRATADETFDAHTAYIDALIALLHDTADGSQLTLDPEIDTFHMMSMSVLRGPMQIENTARLRSLGVLALRSKDLSAVRHDELAQWSAIWRYLDDDIERSYKRGIVAFPEVAKTFDMQGTDDASDAFKDAIAKQLLDTGLAGTAETYARAGDVAAARQSALNSQVMQRLDDQLVARAARLKGMLTMQLVVSAVFVAIAGYLLLAFYRVMMGGLREVAGHLKQITQGNLTTAPKPWGQDEAAQLMTTLGEMQHSLRRTVGQVLSGAGQVRLSSGEIAAASQDLSARTEHTASSLQQAASSMEEISATTQNTTDKVLGAMAIARENAGVATRGGEVIGEVVETMHAIQASSGRIGEIIGVIDGIAFQTNILALNAAVEAARAGEQGRGFAVVASEVRALAGRSAAAAKEIKGLIGDSLAQVEAGSKVAASARATISEIVANAERIGGLMGDIANAAREQSAGVAQVGMTVGEIDHATQQNSALVEQTSAAASALADQAQRLAEEVGFYRIS